MDNIKYKKSFLIIAYGVLVQFFILPFLEYPMLKEEMVKAYLVAKTITVLALLFFILCVHFNKLVKYWVIMFHVFCFTYVLVGQFFNPGYHFAAIQYMFVSAIVFEGFSFVIAAFLPIFLLEYALHPFARTVYVDYPFYHGDVFNALISSWIVSVLLERYVSRVKTKQSFLDRKLRYKGIKTDLFLHDLKNKLQPLSGIKELQEVVEAVRSFNSFKGVEQLSFKSVVMDLKSKHQIEGECLVTGDEDFFIDQMDLQTILTNLMKNSQSAANARRVPLQMILKNRSSGFMYEDNAGGMSSDQISYFNQKEFGPYRGAEKKGYGLFLIKKLVEHQGGKFIVRKTSNGTRFEISY